MPPHRPRVADHPDSLHAPPPPPAPLMPGRPAPRQSHRAQCGSLEFSLDHQLDRGTPVCHPGATEPDHRCGTCASRARYHTGRRQSAPPSTPHDSDTRGPTLPPPRTTPPLLPPASTPSPHPRRRDANPGYCHRLNSPRPLVPTHAPRADN